VFAGVVLLVMLGAAAVLLMSAEAPDLRALAASMASCTDTGLSSLWKPAASAAL
jgi:hypothetical protein